MLLAVKRMNVPLSMVRYSPKDRMLHGSADTKLNSAFGGEESRLGRNALVALAVKSSPLQEQEGVWE